MVENSKKIGDEFESLVLDDLYNKQGFDLISRNVYVKNTGCEVDFVARSSENDDHVWYVEAKGGYKGDKKRPGAQRTDNVKKAIASASLIKALYPSLYFVAYFSSTPKRGSYSEEMISVALRKQIFNDVIYLDPKEKTLPDLLKDVRDDRDKYLLSLIEKTDWEVLDKLGSDYDEDGVAYWEK